MPRPIKDDRTGYLKDFPWLGSRLEFMFGDCRPLAPVENRQIVGRWNVNRYEVDVQRADATFLFRCLKSGERRDPIRDIVVEEKDYLAYVVNGQLHRGVLGHTRPRSIFNQNSFLEVEYVVWVTIQSWRHVQPARAGWKFMERVMKVTIYKPPSEGWAELYRTTTLSDTILTEAELQRGASMGYPDYVAIELKLQDLAKQVADDVYSKGLRDQILASHEAGNHGMSTSGAAITVRSYVVSGCIFINLSLGSTQVTFCGFLNEDEHQEEGLRWLGMNSWAGIHGSIPQVEELLSVTKAAWPMASFRQREINGPF